MTNVLALIEITATGDIATSAPALIAAASKLGTPVAVVATRPGEGAAAGENSPECGDSEPASQDANPPSG